MSLKDRFSAESAFNRRYYGRYFVNLSKKNPEDVYWVKSAYPLGRSHYQTCKLDLIKCEECENMRCAHSIITCMECDKSICGICAWTCTLACKDEHLKGNMGEFQSCSPCKNKKPFNTNVFSSAYSGVGSFPWRRNLATSPPNTRRQWWRGGNINNINIRNGVNNNQKMDEDNQDNRVGGYTNTTLTQYGFNRNGLNRNTSSNATNSVDNVENNEDNVSNNRWWMKKPTKWDTNYNNMIARQKATYQQSLRVSEDCDDNEWDDFNKGSGDNSVKSSDNTGDNSDNSSNNDSNPNDSVKTSDEEEDADNSSQSRNSHEDEEFSIWDIRNKNSRAKLMYDWNDDDDEENERMWGI